MPYPPRSGKQGLCLEEGPVLGPIWGGRFWGLFPNREEPVYAETHPCHENLVTMNGLQC
jgi:hypothetical protein